MRKVWLGLLAAVTLAIVGGFATSANATELSASAATPGQFELCSTGSFLSYAYFPSLVDSNIPGLSFGDTAGVPAGSCVDIPLGNRNVQGYIYDGSADGGITTILLGSVTYHGADGLVVNTVDGPGFTTAS